MQTTASSREALQAELKRIKELQRRWNALDVAERIWIARGNTDLSAFFRSGALPQTLPPRA